MTQDVGSTYRTSIKVTDASGAPVNPATAALAITQPDQTLVTPAPAINLTPAVTGTLIYDYVLAEEGLHRFAWSTTAPVTSLTDYESARAFRAIISLADARNYLGVQDTTKDVLLRAAMAAATDLTEGICGTCVIRTFTNDWITGDWKDVIRLPHGPLPDDQGPITVASVHAGGPSWTLPELVVNPVAGTLRLQNYLPFWFGPWHATYPAGRRVIPERIVQGYKEILWDMWAVLRSLTADMVSPDLTEVSAFETAALYGALPPVGYRVPARALMWFGGEQRPGFA